MKVLVWKNHGDIRVDDATCLKSMIDVCKAICDYGIYYDEPEDNAVFAMLEKATSGSLENIIAAIKEFNHHMRQISAEDFERLEFVEMNTHKRYSPVYDPSEVILTFSDANGNVISWCGTKEDK